MRNITENQYAHWLFNIKGIGNTSLEKILASGLTCEEIFESEGKDFGSFLTAKQISSFDSSKRVWNFELEKKKLEDRNILFIPRIDKRFPEKLKNIPNAPFALYLKGELPDPEKPSVAIIGARMCSEYGRYMARTFGRGLALAGVQVISGMARGIDGISQKAALAAGGKSYGVIGSGADVCYPEENRDVYEELCQNGGIISEFPPGTMPKASFFPMRNRIISGLADIVLVIEAREKSGTQITVDTALEQGREVLAVPGRVTDRLSDGCNMMISQGAGVALDVSDVLERLYSIRNDTKKNKAIIYDGMEAVSSGQKAVDADNEERIKENAKEGGEMPEYKDEAEMTLEDHILGILDIIPVSTSYIMEELYKKGFNITIPILMKTLIDMSYAGHLVQNGAYYRKVSNEK